MKEPQALVIEIIRDELRADAARSGRAVSAVTKRVDWHFAAKPNISFKKRRRCQISVPFANACGGLGESPVQIRYAFVRRPRC
jgi:hypothetical protein